MIGATKEELAEAVMVASVLRADVAYAHIANLIDSNEGSYQHSNGIVRKVPNTNIFDVKLEATPAGTG